MDVVKRRERILTKIDSLKELAAKQAELKETPNKADMKKALEIVLEHVKARKRKIYGGFAIDAAIVAKSPKDGIYDQSQFPDIDFYSPQPLEDVKELCAALIEAGYKEVSGKSAIHGGTLKVRVEHTFEIADVTYCWEYLYHKIPTITTKRGLTVVAPQFQIIDVYKTFVDPLFGWLKIDKNIRRAALLEKLYLLRPFPSPKKKFEDAAIPKRSEKYLSVLIDVLKGREDVVIVGDLAYNIFVESSEVPKRKERLVEVKSVEAYARDLNEVMSDLIKKLKIRKYRIDEYRPLLEKYGSHLRLAIDSTPVLTLYSDAFCLPYKRVFGLQIGSYHVCLRMLYIQRFVSFRDDENLYQKSGYMIHQLQAAREHWLRIRKKLGIEETLFQELQVECIGTAYMSSVTQSQKNRKRNPFYSYNPYKPSANPPIKYPNSSGSLVQSVDEKGAVTKPARSKTTIADTREDLLEANTTEPEDV